MKTFTYQPGLVVEIESVPCQFLSPTIDAGWSYLDLHSNRATTKTIEELDALYSSGALCLPLEPDAGWSDLDNVKKRVNKRQHVIFSELSKRDQRRIKFRLSILKHVAGSTLPGTLDHKIDLDGAQTTILEKALGEICTKLGRKKAICRDTYYQWKALLEKNGDICDLRGDFYKRGRRGINKRVHQIITEEMHRAIDEGKRSKARKRYKKGKKATCTISSIMLAVSKRLEIEVVRDPSSKLSLPCRNTFLKIWRDFPAYDRTWATKGKSQADNLFRITKGTHIVEGSLDEVQYDETRLPIFVYHEELGIPLGRPWLTWYLDVHSAVPIGFYFGFEPPSDLTISAALRHACVPKTYVKDHFPHINNRYPAYGRPKLMVYDRSLCAFSDSLSRIAYDLDVPYRWTRTRSPWFKGMVETMFNVLNQELLRELPSFTLSKEIPTAEYNPLENGCLGLRQLSLIFHTWLIDVYMQTPTGVFPITPADAWMEGLRGREPSKFASVDDLDRLFAIEREGKYQTLDHRSVVFSSIRMTSNELQQMRLRYGHNQKVVFKVDPSNLSRGWVLDDREQYWIEVEPYDEWKDYCRGLSLHVHELNLKQARSRYGNDHMQSLWKAKQDLTEMIAEALPRARKIQTATLMARALGIGTQHLLGGIDSNGQLPAPSGPFSGLSFNPLATPTMSNSSAVSTSEEDDEAATLESAEVRSLGKDGTGGGSSPDDHGAERRKLDIPVFNTSRMRI